MSDERIPAPIERGQLVGLDEAPVTGGGDLIRIALVADGVASLQGVTQTLEQLRERGIAGYEVDVIGTDAGVERRLAAVAEVELPLYPGVKLGVPSLFAVARALTERSYDVVHVCAPGPAGTTAGLVARVIGLPVLGSYHTGLPAGARLRPRERCAENVARATLAAFYGQCSVVLSPSIAADASLAQLGILPERIVRWDRGVDLGRYTPARYAPQLLPDAFNVLHVGPLCRENGVDLLAEAFLTARDRDPRLHLVLAGRGPEESTLRRRLGSAATFLGRVDGDLLARVYATADLFIFASLTDAFGRVILEAQASGLPVLAVDAGGRAELIEDGRSGCLVPPEAGALASALRGLAQREAIRERLVTGGLLAVRERSCERSLVQLAAGYAHAIGGQDESDTGTDRALTTVQAARAA